MLPPACSCPRGHPPFGNTCRRRVPAVTGSACRGAVSPEWKLADQRRTPRRTPRSACRYDLVSATSWTGRFSAMMNPGPARCCRPGGRNSGEYPGCGGHVSRRPAPAPIPGAAAYRRAAVPACAVDGAGRCAGPCWRQVPVEAGAEPSCGQQAWDAPSAVEAVDSKSDNAGEHGNSLERGLRSAPACPWRTMTAPAHQA